MKIGGKVQRIQPCAIKQHRKGGYKVLPPVLVLASQTLPQPLITKIYSHVSAVSGLDVGKTISSGNGLIVKAQDPQVGSVIFINAATAIYNNGSGRGSVTITASDGFKLVTTEIQPTIIKLGD
jgi:hypothetical protein